MLVVESPLALPDSVNTSVSDQKHFFSLNFFFQESSCHGIFDFLFEISALESLLPQCFAGMLFMCACRVQGWQNHSFAFCISYIFKKSKNICLSSCIAFCTLHCNCTRYRFALEYQLGLHIGNICIHHLKKNCAFHIVCIPCLHGHNAFALIVMMCILLHVVS